ncbi:MAG: IPTL-CTERM sorting domain-containing protein, partial [Candidatus Eisenbacteria bacterium]|nr:IPTL-CTERM sorting domain-containing protein [Candidatus Eisenbacteria bacterium]
PQKVPSLTEWGVIILAMLIAAAGVIAVLRRRAAVRAC